MFSIAISTVGWGDVRNPNVFAIRQYVGFRSSTQPTVLCGHNTMPILLPLVLLIRLKKEEVYCMERPDLVFLLFSW